MEYPKVRLKPNFAAIHAAGTSTFSNGLSSFFLIVSKTMVNGYLYIILIFMYSSLSIWGCFYQDKINSAFL